jgi:epoxyqueuosine reductase
LHLWAWTEAEFEQRHEGSAIRRIGYSRWRRNLAVAMGNAINSPLVSDADKEQIRNALSEGLATADALVTEHIEWALNTSF